MRLLIIAFLLVFYSAGAQAQTGPTLCGQMLLLQLRSMVNEPAPTESDPWMLHNMNQQGIRSAQRTLKDEHFATASILSADNTGDISLTTTCTDVVQSTCAAMRIYNIDPTTLVNDTEYPSWLRDDIAAEIAAGAC